MHRNISDISIESSAHTDGNNYDFEAEMSHELFPLKPDSEGSIDSLSPIAVVLDSGKQIKSISSKEYYGLLKLIPKTALLEQTIEIQKIKIKEKDELIENMKQTHKRELETKSLFPNLTHVSLSILILYFSSD